MKNILKALFFFLLVTAPHHFQAQTTKPNKVANLNNLSATDGSGGKVSIMNSTGDVLLDINDEASGGSITFPPLSTIDNSTNKLYNLGNVLYWNNEPLVQSNTNNGWYVTDQKLLLSDPSYLIGIGTQNPLQKLHIENGKILVQGIDSWFPGLTIQNYVGRSVFHLRGTTSSSNFSSTEIVFADLTNGNTWSLLNTNTNTFTIVNHQDGTNYKSPLKIDFGAPTNSLTINSIGNVGIGSLPNEHKLAIAGSIISEEVIVKLQSNWPDHVFNDDYQLPELVDVKQFIHENHHLEGIPSENEIQNNGINIASIQSKLLQKIEELTLYVIKQDEEINSLKDEVVDLRNRVGGKK